MTSNGRMYPDRPYVGVGAVIVHEGRVVLVKRRFEPLAGTWSIPGGAVEVGETLEACVAREMLEETGFVVEVGPVIEVLDRITHDDASRVLYHFVLVDYLCWPIGGELRAGTDVAEAVLAEANDLDRYALTDKARAVIERALELARDMPPPVGRE
ncbi:MAG TPA: NUDIX hydrolase [Vicinamibacterales bacterium]|jgi:8-oxo-dGTP diphosphatase|nr:NUDIX hydrolase [Vicinamibacterales bacterium]